MWIRGIAAAAMLAACTSPPLAASPEPAQAVATARAPIEPTSPTPGVITSATLRLRITLPAWPDALAWTPDGARLVVGDDQGVAQIWDARTGQRVRELGRFSQRVTAIAASKAHVAATGAAEVRVWAAATGALEREWHDNGDLVSDLQFAGEALLAVDLRDTLLRGDLRSGRAVKVAVPTLHRLALAIEPGGAGLALGGYGALELIDVAGGARRFKLEMPDCRTAPADLLCAEWREHEITEFPVRENERGPHTYKTTGPDSAVTGLAFSADGARLALGRADGVVAVIDVATGEPIARFDTGDRKHPSVGLTVDGRALAVGDRDGRISVWDLASRRELRVVDEPGHIVSSVAFSGDAMALAAGGPGQSVTVWDLGR